MWAKIWYTKLINRTYDSIKEIISDLIDCFEYIDDNNVMVSRLTNFKWFNLDV